MYARRLTKEELLKGGITQVTEDGRVFRGETEAIPTINNQGYITHYIYELDALGNRIRVANSKSIFGYTYKMRSIGLHRLMWAWFHDEVPAGFVVDHINNKHETIEDYHISNLQLLTPGQNVAKDRDGDWLKYELPCKLNRPRTFYEDKLNMYLAKYEKAKADHDAEAAHYLRCNISQYKARLRYYDAHIDEARALYEAKNEETTRLEYKHSRAEQIKRFKYELKVLHDRYKECRDTLGESHHDTVVAKAKWKRGIRISNEWVENHPVAKKEKNNVV